MWIVAAVMALVGMLFVFPVLRYGFPALSGLGEGKFAAAFSSLLLAILVLVGVWGVAFVVLAVQLVRGRPEARILTAVLGAGVGVGVLSAGGVTAGGAGSHSALSVLVGLAALAVSAAVLFLPATRRFFAAKAGGVPVSVSAVSALALYYGIDSIAAGVFLLPVATFDKAFVAYGLLLIAAGVAVLFVGRGLRGGSRVARGLLSLIMVAEAGVVIAVGSGEVSPTAVIGVTVSLAALMAIWVDRAAVAFFSRSIAPDDGSLAPAAVTERATAGVLVGCAALGAVIWVGVQSTGCRGYGCDSVATTFAASATTFAPPPTYYAPTPDYTPTDDYPTTPADTPSSDPTPTSSYSQPPDSTFVRSWTGSQTADGGYTMGLTLAVGAPQKFQEGLQIGSVTAGAACSIDSSTAAVIPARVVVTNSTSGHFSLYPSWNLSLGYNSDLEAEVYYSDDGADCKDGSLGVQWTTELASGSSNTSYFFFVLANYYTPDHPDGDPSVLAQAVVTFQNTSNTNSSDRSFSPTGFTGPGVGDYGSLPLDGVGDD